MDLTDEPLRDRLDVADQQVVADGLQRRLVGERHVDENRALHDLLPAPQARREPRLIARVLREAHRLVAAIGDVGKAVHGHMRARHRHVLGGKRGNQIGVLLGQQLGAAGPSRRQHPVTVLRGGAEHRLRMTGDVDRQRLLHRPRRDVRFRHAVVLAVVAEEIPAESEVEDVAELVRHLEVLLEIDAEALEFVGLVTGADPEHEPPVRQGVGRGNLGEQARRVVQRHDDHGGAEPDLLRHRRAVRHHQQGRCAQAVVREMMLGEPRDRIPQLVGQLRLLGDLAEYLRRRRTRIARAHQVENAEFHNLNPRFRSMSGHYRPGSD